MKIKLYLKLTIIFSFALVISLISAYFFLSYNLKNYIENNTKNHLKHNILLAKDIILNLNDLKDLSYVINDLSKKLDLRVSFIDEDGYVIADSSLHLSDLKDLDNHGNRPEVLEAVSTGFGYSKRYSKTINKDLLYMAVKVQKESFLYVLRFSMPLEDVSILSADINKIISISLILIFIFSIIFIYFILIYVSKPLIEMSRFAKAISKGDFNTKNIMYTNDEIGDLAKALTFMSQEVKYQIEKLKQETSKLDAVLNNMLEGIMLLDKDFKILFMNNSVKKILYIVSNIEGKFLNELTDNNYILELSNKILKEGSSINNYEMSISIPRKKTLQINAVPIFRDNNIDGGVFVFHDITKLRELENLKQEFVANVSHELRTPITIIKGYAETILDGAIDDKDNLKEFISIIYKDSNRLANLIDDLLDLSKIESGKVLLQFKESDLKELIDDCIGVLKNIINKKNHTLNIVINTDIKTIFVDDKKILQVLFNLLDNAIKYTQDNGTIELKVKDKNNYIQFDITDNGIGIPEDDLNRIFERFYRVDKARSREMGGTGLGLSIVKHIVLAHCGEVWVKSNINQGSVFSFTIPKSL